MDWPVSQLARNSTQLIGILFEAAPGKAVFAGATNTKNTTGNASSKKILAISESQNAGLFFRTANVSKSVAGIAAGSRKPPTFGSPQAT